MRHKGIYSDIQSSVKLPGEMTPDDRYQRARDPVEEATRQWAERYEDASGFRGLVSLIRTYGAVIRSVEAQLRPYGLNLSRYEVLLLLSFTRTGCLPSMRLRDLLMVHGSSVTYLVDRLEEAGFVARRADPDDGRVALVCLTDAGRAVVEEASHRLVEHEFGAFGGLSEHERELLSALLAALRNGDATAS